MTHPGKNPGMPERYPTPNEIPEDEGYLVFKFPNDEGISQLITGALTPLAYSYNYYEWGEISPDEISELMRLIIQDAPYNLLDNTVPAPYWETGGTANDTMPKDSQIWYGYVSEGNFVEDAGIWIISNFLASSLGEKAAILYATNERKVRLSFLRGGLGGVVTIYAGDALAAVVDLLGTEGEVVDVDVLTGYVDEAVEILQVLDA